MIYEYIFTKEYVYRNIIYYLFETYISGFKMMFNVETCTTRGGLVRLFTNDFYIYGRNQYVIFFCSVCITGLISDEK